MRTKLNLEIEIEDGKVVSVKTIEPGEDIIKPVSNYARFFDEGCTGWQNDAEYNLIFLRSMQNYANDLLRSRGYLFLNEVYDLLGIPRSKEGQLVGWVYDKDDPKKGDFVDFGIFNLDAIANREFVNGFRKSVLLDFNVYGNIIDVLEGKEDGEA